jgi:hypothetical protein
MFGSDYYVMVLNERMEHSMRVSYEDMCICNMEYDDDGRAREREF